MARYTGPTNKLFRNYGVTELSNRKLTSSMRQTESGQHGAMRKKLSEYALHLKEKQKIRQLVYGYGLVDEEQCGGVPHRNKRTPETDFKKSTSAHNLAR